MSCGQKSTHRPHIVSNPIDKKGSELGSEFMHISMQGEAPSMPTAAYNPRLLREQETPLEIQGHPGTYKPPKWRGLSIPRSSVRFRLKPDNSNSHEFELHRPSNKGTKLLLKVIKAIIIIKSSPLDFSGQRLGNTSLVVFLRFHSFSLVVKWPELHCYILQILALFVRSSQFNG